MNPTSVPDAQFVDWGLKQFGPPTVMLAFFIIALMRKWIVIGWQYTDLQAECVARQLKSDAEVDEWKEMALRSVGLAETTVAIKQRSS